MGIFDFDENSKDGIRNVVLPERDWMTLTFNMLNNKTIGEWKCFDGWTNYKIDRLQTFATHIPNERDTKQDCQIVSSGVT